MSNAVGDQAVASNAIYNLYNQLGNTDTYSAPGTDVSDVVNQATFRSFVKNAMPLNSNEAQRIGGIEDPAVINQLLSFDGSALITDVQVFGDTVYVAVASVRDTNHQGDAGIFSSTALFNHTGEIRAWTPWQRVMGSTDGAYGMGFDGASSNFWYFTTPTGVVATGTPPSQVNVTQWGKGDPTIHGGSSATDTSTLLSTVIDNAFPDGVYGLFNFGPDTPGFKPRIPGDLTTPANRYEQFGMMVAAGKGQIAIIETGSLARGGLGIFQPTTAFTQFTYGNTLATDLNATVYLFAYDSPDARGEALEDLGTITTAEVSRLSSDQDDVFTGWLFVGGDNGVAVLVQDYEGNGWANGAGEGVDRLLPGDQLTGVGSGSEDFPGGLRWFFVQLKLKVPATATTPESGVNIFNNVRKLVSDGDKYLYILTNRALFRIEMNAVNFSSDVNWNNLETRIDAANISIVATMSDSKLLGSSPLKPIGNRTDSFFDMMVVQRDKTPGHETSSLLIATSKGMFLCDNVTDVPQATSVYQWERLSGMSDAPIGASLSFEFASTERGQKMLSTFDNSGDEFLSAEGNLSVLAFDKNLNYLARYRFNISNGFIDPFDEVYNTDHFYKIGNLVDPGNTRSNLLMVNYPLFGLTANFPGSDSSFSSHVPVMPDPNKFLKPEGADSVKPIDLGFRMSLPVQGGRFIQDGSSGAMYIGGQFGVRVNE